MIYSICLFLLCRFHEKSKSNNELVLLTVCVCVSKAGYILFIAALLSKNTKKVCYSSKIC